MPSLGEQLHDEIVKISAATLTFLVITWIAVVTRMCVRTFISHSVGWDDWTMLVAQLFYTATAALTFVSNDLATDVFEAKTANVNLALILRLLNSFSTTTMVFVKISLSLFFLKIFTVGQIWRRSVIYVCMAASIVVGLMQILAYAIIFEVVTEDGVTNNSQTSELFNRLNLGWAILNPITDFAFSAISVVAISTMRMKLAAKITAGILLMFGTVGGVASVFKVAVFTGALPPGLHSIFYGIVCGRWTNIEDGIAITAGSLATLRPLLRKLWGKRRNSAFASRPLTDGRNLSSSCAPPSIRTHVIHDMDPDSLPGDAKYGYSSTVSRLEAEMVQAGNGRMYSLQTHDMA